MSTSLRLAHSLLVIVLLALSAVALAQVDADEIAAALRTDGYYVAEGAELDPAAIEALDSASVPIYLVVLAGDAGEDESLIAQRVGEGFGSGIFVVRTPGGIGMFWVDHSDAETESVIDESLEGWRSSNAEGIEDLEKAMTGKGGFPTGRVLLGALAALVGWGIYRGRSSSKRAEAQRIEERRAALREQADDVADDIIALSDRVQLDGDGRATEHYRAANGIFSETQEAISSTTSEMAFAELSTQLTKAEWHLESVEAILDGREVPVEPTDRPIECFFHQHKAGVEEAQIDTPAGRKSVSVCRDCAGRLARGVAPEPRDVVVGGTRMPRAQAPRSYGGGGLDLDVFDVVVGPRRTSYDWSRSSPRVRTTRRPRPTRLSGRPSGTQRSSSRSSGKSPRSSGKKSGGRARRRL